MRKSRALNTAFLLGAIFVLAGANSALAAPKGTVSDLSLSLGVGSDGEGIYVDGQNCVSVVGDKRGRGFYQLRTVSNSEPGCKVNPFVRFLTLNFGVDSNGVPLAPGDLDGDGENEQVEGPPARFIAFTAFGKKAARDGTEVAILVMEVNADGSTTQETAWNLQYQNLANVEVIGNDVRRIYLPQETADADLFEIELIVNGRGKVKKKETHRGTYTMPFEVFADINN